MKKKELYKVEVNNQNTAHSFKHALIAIGENVCHEYFDVYEKEMVLIFSVGDDEWMLVNKTHSTIGKRKFIEFKELISLLVSNVKPKSILDGKVAIQVSNDREFELLMKHYEEKGWNDIGGVGTKEINHIEGICWKYGNSFSWASERYWKEKGYTIIPFADFAKEVGIEAPVFILKSEDGVDLYEGDNCYWTEKVNGKFRGAFLTCLNNKPDNDLIFLSTREAAELWISEQNKTEEIVGYKLSNGKTANITHKSIRVFNGNDWFNISPSDVEDLHHALKQLKGGDNA